MAEARSLREELTSLIAAEVAKGAEASQERLDALQAAVARLDEGLREQAESPPRPELVIPPAPLGGGLVEWLLWAVGLVVAVVTWLKRRGVAEALRKAIEAAKGLIKEYDEAPYTAEDVAKIEAAQVAIEVGGIRQGLGTRRRFGGSAASQCAFHLGGAVSPSPPGRRTGGGGGGMCMGGSYVSMYCFARMTRDATSSLTSSRLLTSASSHRRSRTLREAQRRCSSGHLLRFEALSALRGRTARRSIQLYKLLPAWEVPVEQPWAGREAVEGLGNVLSTEAQPVGGRNRTQVQDRAATCEIAASGIASDA